MLAFTDDNYVPRVNCAIPSSIKDIEKILRAITKWLRDSGLVDNQNKTELCLFYKRDVSSITITLGDAQIKSKQELNVLVVIFDSRLQWSNHVNSVLIKPTKL
jgi:hypothetical protein